MFHVHYPGCIFQSQLEANLQPPANPEETNVGDTTLEESPNLFTLPETNIAHENPIFPGKYHQNGGFSMAMLVYRSVVLASVSVYSDLWVAAPKTNISWNEMMCLEEEKNTDLKSGHVFWGLQDFFGVNLSIENPEIMCFPEGIWRKNKPQIRQESWSFDLASAARSTITAKIRFNIPNETWFSLKPYESMDGIFTYMNGCFLW